MPGIGNGFTTAITGSVVGFVTSMLVSAILPVALPEMGSSVALLFNIVAILIGIESLHKAKHWGILYTVGYIAGVLIIGKYFMESWELVIYALVVGGYLILKIKNKVW